MKIIDISQKMYPGMPVYPGDPTYQSRPVSCFKDGQMCEVSELTFGSHCGTHVDAPMHMIEHGAPLDSLPLDCFIGVIIVSLPYQKKALSYARELRRSLTAEERHLWYDFLRDYPVKIKKQKPVGNYIVDFYCESARLVIELDGSQHYEDAGKEYDGERSRYLESLGLMVVRFSNLEINREFRAVCEYLDDLITKRRELFRD